MTRETKIGLLVGLAFIIVIGILLSDHMSSSTEPPQAALNNTGNSVREGITSPAAAAADAPTGDTVVITQPVTPRQPVQTRRELSPSASGTPPTPGETIVRIGPGDAGSSSQVRRPPTPVAPPTDPIARNTGPASGNDAPAPSGPPGSIGDIANQQGEPLVPAGPPVGPAAAPAAAGPHKYVAEAGDTLNRLAGRFLGGNTKAARDAIVKANPSLAADPNRIIVGRTYVIPAATSAATLPPIPTAPTAAAPTPAAATITIWYTVKESDSLWSIAADRLGNGGAFTAIKELNKDILKGGDTVTPNMRLRLPAGKAVASIQ